MANVQAPTVDKLYALGQTIGAGGNNTFQSRRLGGSYSPRSSEAAPAPQQRQGNGGLGSVAGDMAGKALQMYQAGLLGGGSSAAASGAGTGAALNSAAATGASNVAAGMGASAGSLPSAASMGFGGGAAAGGSAAGGAGGSAMGAAFSNPVTGLAALIAGNVIYQNNKGISSYSDTLKGRAGGNTLDYYGGRDDGKTHGGILGKIADQDGATGQSLKGITDFSELDFKNGIKNSLDAAKSALKFKFF